MSFEGPSNPDSSEAEFPPPPMEEGSSSQGVFEERETISSPEPHHEQPNPRAEAFAELRETRERLEKTVEVVEANVQEAEVVEDNLGRIREELGLDPSPSEEASSVQRADDTAAQEAIEAGNLAEKSEALALAAAPEQPEEKGEEGSVPPPPASEEAPKEPGQTEEASKEAQGNETGSEQKKEAGDGEKKLSAEELSKKNFYDRLGVSRDASPKEIKDAYRKMAREYHPDKGGGEGADKSMRQLSEAYNALKDGDQRGRYDQKLSHQEADQRARDAAKTETNTGPSGRSYTYTYDSAKGSNQYSSTYSNPNTGPRTESSANQQRTGEAEYARWSDQASRHAAENARSPFRDTAAEWRDREKQYGAPNFVPPPPPYESYSEPSQPARETGAPQSKEASKSREQVEREREFNDGLFEKVYTRGKFTVGAVDGVEFLLDPENHEAISMPYERIVVKGEYVIGKHEGQQYLLDAETGDERSTGFKRIMFTKAGMLLGVSATSGFLLFGPTGRVAKRLFERRSGKGAPSTKN